MKRNVFSLLSLTFLSFTLSGCVVAPDINKSENNLPSNDTSLINSDALQVINHLHENSNDPNDLSVNISPQFNVFFGYKNNKFYIRHEVVFESSFISSTIIEFKYYDNPINGRFKLDESDRLCYHASFECDINKDHETSRISKTTFIEGNEKFGDNRSVKEHMNREAIYTIKLLNLYLQNNNLPYLY